MTTQPTTRVAGAIFALILFALVAASPRVAKPRIPELRDARPSVKRTNVTPKPRASVSLRRAGSAACGVETYVIELEGRPVAQVC